MAVKNHNEVLRCFTVACKLILIIIIIIIILMVMVMVMVMIHGYLIVAGKFHPQRVVSYLLTKLETNQDKIKGGTQEVFKHLMNSCGMSSLSLSLSLSLPLLLSLSLPLSLSLSHCELSPFLCQSL